MPRSRYARRLETLANERSAALAVAIRPGFAPSQPMPGHSARVRRALALAVGSGIRADDAYPIVLRTLAGVGILLRPVHFMPLWVPLLLGALIGMGVFGMAVGCLDLLATALPVLIPVADAGALWMGAGSAASGLVFAAMIRLQARRANLPRWADV